MTREIVVTVRPADFASVSDPPDTSESICARIGFEANGVVLPPAGTPAPDKATPAS